MKLRFFWGIISIIFRFYYFCFSGNLQTAFNLSRLMFGGWYLLKTAYPDRVVHMLVVKFRAVGISLRSTAYPERVTHLTLIKFPAVGISLRSTSLNCICKSCFYMECYRKKEGTGKNSFCPNGVPADCANSPDFLWQIVWLWFAAGFWYPPHPKKAPLSSGYLSPSNDILSQNPAFFFRKFIPSSPR